MNDIAPTIRCRPGDNFPTVYYETDSDVTFALQGGGVTSQNSQGCGWKRNIMFTLNLTDVHGVVYEIHQFGTSS